MFFWRYRRAKWSVAQSLSRGDLLRRSEIRFESKPVIAPHHVRPTPRGVVSEYAVRRRRVELRIDVEHVQDVQLDQVVLIELVTQRQIRVPLGLRGAVHRTSIDVGLRRRMAGRILQTIAFDATEVD